MPPCLSAVDQDHRSRPGFGDLPFTRWRSYWRTVATLGKIPNRIIVASGRPPTLEARCVPHTRNKTLKFRSDRQDPLIMRVTIQRLDQVGIRRIFSREARCKPCTLSVKSKLQSSLSYKLEPAREFPNLSLKLRVTSIDMRPNGHLRSNPCD